MADSKITALTSISTSTDPANDPLVIVDVSDTSMAATGTTKKVTLNQLLATSPTATLASATITGDLTVDTSTLKVDSTNNRVGIGTASPAAPLDVQGSSLRLQVQSSSNGAYATWRYIGKNSTGTAVNFEQGLNIAADNAFELYDNQNTQLVSRYVSGVSGAHSWFLTGTTAMTLNSTGLGVGGSVLAKISAYLTSTATYNSAAAGDETDFQISRVNNSTVSGQSSTIALNTSSDNGANVARVYLACVQESNGSYASAFTVKTRNSAGTNAERLRIDSSGNVGIGVTPSAWYSAFRTLQIAGTGAYLSSYTAGSTINQYTYVGNNSFYNGTSSRWEYIRSKPSVQYIQYNNEHQWWRDTGTQTAGADCAFTQAMTLDASGNLLVGTTGLNGSWNTKLTLSNDSGTTKWAVGPYLGGVTNFLISAGASAGVYLNGTAATSWTSASDERLKDIIEPISNAVSKVASLRAVIGKFKFDENNTRKPFLIAQDIQAVLPEAVDASNPDKLGVAYTDVIPLLVAAIKELTARVQTIETR